MYISPPYLSVFKCSLWHSHVHECICTCIYILCIRAKSIISSDHYKAIFPQVESGGKNIEIDVMTKENGLRQLEESEIDAIVAETEAEKAAAEAAKKAPARETCS